MDIFLNYGIFICFGLILYTWIFFPVSLLILAKLSRPIIVSSSYFPTLSVIVAAANEERNIAAKIENLFAQDYPRDKLEIIIASDGSKDQTVAIASQYPGVKVLDFPQRRGRAMVHNDSAKVATGEILIFSDAETIFQTDFLHQAVAYFSLPEYGCGAGDYSFFSSETIGNTEGLYWKIEKRIRQDQFTLNILSYASGGCFLIRKTLFTPINPHSDIDNILPLIVLEKGYKVFYASHAKAYDVTINTAYTHFQKRLRIAQQAMMAFMSRFPALWKKRRYAILFVLISHRFIRWATGILLMALLFFTSLQCFLNPGLFICTFLAVQLIVYTLGILGWQIESKKLHFLGSQYMVALYSFLLAIGAFLVAIKRSFEGKRISMYNTLAGTSQ